MAELEGEILTLEEVAAYLKAGKRTVYRLVADKKIPAFKLGGTWRFHKAELERWIASQTSHAAFDGEHGEGMVTHTASTPKPKQPAKRKTKG